MGTHNIRKYKRAKNRLAKLQQDIAALEDKSNVRYPPGVVPFASSATWGELDELWSGTLETERNFVVPIPVSMSRRKAMALVHHAAALHYRRVEAEAEQERLARQKSEAQKSHLEKLVNTLALDATSRDSAALLGLD